MSSLVKAISIHQPWAWMILSAGKDIENRDWATGYRGRLYIHASKSIDPDGIDELAERHLRPEQLICGALIGHVLVSDCVDQSTSDWFRGRYGIVLRDPVKIAPITQRGKLGIYDTTLEPERGARMTALTII